MTDLAGHDLVENFTWTGTVADPLASYFNSGLFANLTLAAANAATVVSEPVGAFVGPFNLFLTGAGQFILNGASGFSGSFLMGSVRVSVKTNDALGANAINFGGTGATAKLESLTANYTTAQPIFVLAGGSPTLEAATGDSLTLTGPFAASGGSGTTLHFGSVTDTGAVVLNTSSMTADAAGAWALDGGSLKLASASAASLVSTLAGGVTLNGALDLAGQSVTLTNPNGAGNISNSSATAATLTVNNTIANSLDVLNGTLSGAINLVLNSGALEVDSKTAITSAGVLPGATLDLNNHAQNATFTTNTLVDVQATLSVYGGGALTFASALTGNGVTAVKGAHLIMTGDRSRYGGSFTVASDATLTFASTKIEVGVSDREHLVAGVIEATVDQTFTGALHLNGDATLEATAGHTLTYAGQFADLGHGGVASHLHIGSATETGTVAINPNGGVGFNIAGGSIEIDGGTLSLGAGLNLVFTPVTFKRSGDKLVLNNTQQTVAVSAAAGITDEVDLNNGIVAFTGGGQNVYMTGGSASVASLASTGGVWDNVYEANGATGTVYLTSAQAQVYGGGEAVQFIGGAGNAAHLISTGASWDVVSAANGSSGTVYLNNAFSQVWGGGDTIYFWAGINNQANLFNTGAAWDTIYAGAGETGTVYLNSAHAQVVGGGDTVWFQTGASNAAHLANTGNVFDNVYSANGAGGLTYMTNALANYYGAGYNIAFWSGTTNGAHLLNTAGTWDVVSALNGATGTVYLDSALAQVWGGGNTVDFYGGGAVNSAQLLNTGAVADTVLSQNGAKGTIYLSSASANISGGGETVAFWSGASNSAGLTGTGYNLLFNLPGFGLATVTGYAATDALSFSAFDQGKLTITHSGADTLITLDASDVVTLKNYLGAVTPTYHP